ncbi:MAG: hypothetical protein R3E08_09440 [Thiotrichaceae bacterium]
MELLGELPFVKAGVTIVKVIGFVGSVVARSMGNQSQPEDLTVLPKAQVFQKFLVNLPTSS